MILGHKFRAFFPLLCGAGLLIAAPAPALAQATPKPISPKPNSQIAAQVKREMAKPFYVVEKLKGFATLQAAVDEIGDGRGTIRIASGHYRLCAVQAAGEIAYVAAEAGGAIFENILCEGKAGLVLRGQMARLDGVIFQNYRGPQSEAAASALALEGGALHIVNSLFRTSDRALVTADLPAISVSIRQASFQSLGRCASAAGPCDAGIVTGRLLKLRLNRNEFNGAALATAAAQLDFEYNVFGDSGVGPVEAIGAPLVDLLSGAVGHIKSNSFTLRKAARGSLGPVIAVASRDTQNGSRGLLIDENQVNFAPELSGEALFVANYSGENVAVGDNLYGTGIRAYDRPQRPAPVIIAPVEPQPSIAPVEAEIAEPIAEVTAAEPAPASPVISETPEAPLAEEGAAETMPEVEPDQASPRVSINDAANASEGDLPPHSTN